MEASPKLSHLATRLLHSGLAADPVAAPAAEVSPAPALGKRLKLWEQEGKHHCPIIGTCLAVDDLVRFARRFGFKASLRDEYSLHSEAVSWSRSRNEVSETLQRHLDRKYQATLDRFSKLKSDGEVRRIWQDCLARGEVAGPLWAVFSHRAASAETRQQAYADVHMLSHQVGAGQAADSRRLGQLEKENAELKKSAAQDRLEAERQAAGLRDQVAGLQARLAEQKALRDEIGALRARLQQLEAGQALAEMGRRVHDLEAQNAVLKAAAQRQENLDQALQASREETAQARRERDELASERDALERLLLAAAGKRDGCAGQCESCDQPLSQQCILYVGGRTALVHHYKALAERLGIRLIHHDGGLEESISRLPEMIHGADAVVCPTDCISHTAYYQLKNHCKRSGKPCLFFKGAGVSSFAVAMAKVTGGEFSLPGQAPTESA